MRRVVGSFYHLDALRFANVYLFDGGAGDRWLVDTGHPLERAKLLLELRRSGLSPADLRGALLTHRHSDHAGNAAFLQRQFGVRVFAHQADAAVLAGSSPRARLARGEGSLVAGAFAWLENLWPARVRVDYPLSGGEVVAGLEVHWVPGHTEGSVFFRHAPTLSLATGDTLMTAHPPLAVRRGLSLPYSTFTQNMDQALESLRAFHQGDYPYEHLLPGHGPPVSGGARAQVLQFLGDQRVRQR
jgi:glyoxylase-like metal-dependent hydrolase (beta-lactamase superfamily II)